MEGAHRAVAVADLPKQQEVATTATVVAAVAEEKEVPVSKEEDTTATAVATAEVQKQEDMTSSGAADDEEKEAVGMKRKLAKTVFKSPYDSNYDDDEPYEIIPTILVQHDMEDGNKESFIEKEAQKIREKGKATYFRRGMFRCPYCTTKPKPRDGVYEHLMSHARGLSRSDDQDIKTRAEHAALLKALGPI
ncbi:putative LRR receptor-like serine/threonine-protein kinase [Hordeum vulgare]|nr:putative LRR receptor-like serine/threonine-protein kinase [Hordeum vulgare]